MPFFSIIIPSYNTALTLETAIESVLGQSFDNLELIIVDGLSKDNAVSIMKRFAADDGRISYVSEPDRGVYDAMNKGIKMARGEWLYFLGADDYLFDRNVLANIFASASANPGVHLIYGNVSSAYLGEKYDGEFDQMKISRQNICHQSIFYHKKLFNLLSGYNLKYRIHADWELNLRCFLHPKVTTKYIDLIIAYFSGGGLSNTEDDLIFRSEKNAIIVRNGYHSIPFKRLKFFCRSNLEFARFTLKRFFYYLKRQYRTIEETRYKLVL